MIEKHYLKAETYFCCFLAYLKEKKVEEIQKENCWNTIQILKENPNFKDCLGDFLENNSPQVLDQVFQVLEHANYLLKEEESQNYKIMMNNHIKELILNQMERDNYRSIFPSLKLFFETYQNPKKERNDSTKVMEESIPSPIISKKVEEEVKEQKDKITLSNVSDFLIAFLAYLHHENETNVLDEEVFSQTIDSIYNNVYHIRLDGSLIPFLENYFGRTFLAYTDENVAEVFQQFINANVLERDPSGNFRFKIRMPLDKEMEVFQKLNSMDAQKLEQFSKRYLEIYHQFIVSR